MTIPVNSDIDYEGDKSKGFSDAGSGETFAEVLTRRISRRGVVKGALATAGALAVTGPVLDGVAAQDATPESAPAETMGVRGLGFDGIAQSTGDIPTVAVGYTITPFLRWGDPIIAGAPEFSVATQSAEAQEMQFGYNCDWIGFLPLPMGADTSDHGLLVVNHEYTNPELMFPGYRLLNPDYDPTDPESQEFLIAITQPLLDIELAAHGMSIVEIERDADGAWQLVLDSTYNRRITATTPTTVTGPAAGHDLLKTAADPTGAEVSGTLNNCAGGITPWGTILSGEENFHQYFGKLDEIPGNGPIKRNHIRYGFEEILEPRFWDTIYDRFDLTKEPTEPFRFGWGVEVDPYDPTATPKKRTALGRFKHEGLTSVVAPDGRVVLYSGDDERFDYAYKFITASPYDPDDREANMDLLDEGTLYAAKFNEDGTGEWLPLVFGEGELTEANGFTSQADVLLHTREAGDAVGATKMDRPEDFETNPVTGKLYLVLTNNTRRGTEGREDVDAANPVVANADGHIIEITPEGDDHASTQFAWELFMVCGDPSDEATYFAGFDKERVSSISSPDNITFDLDGNLWITSDGQPRTLKVNDGLYAVPVEGESRGHLKLFMTGVPGGEVSGPVFTPDNRSLFASIQHPGEGGRFELPMSLFPDGETLARPSVVLVERRDGGRIGS